MSISCIACKTKLTLFRTKLTDRTENRSAIIEETGREKPMKIAVCDDDEWIRKYLKTVIKQEIGMEADLYSSGEELLECQKAYDILFLDICLADHENEKQKN